LGKENNWYVQEVDNIATVEHRNYSVRQNDYNIAYFANVLV